MTNPEPESGTGVKRRPLLAGISSIATATIAGCGNDQNGTSEGETVSATESTTETPGETSGDDPDELREEIGAIYDGLAGLPVAEGDEFVFDVNAFEDDFDREELFDDADDVLDRLEARDPRDESGSRTETLIAVTELAKQLVNQRVIVHQVIAAGLAYERELNRNEYERATEAIRDARQFTVDLQENGERIEEALGGVEPSTLRIDGYRHASERDSQEVLVEIALWTGPAYEGLHHAVRGFRRYKDGTEALDGDSYGTAGAAYEESEERFEAAVAAFDRAQGRGRRLPHMAPLVDSMRCTLPGYLASCEGLLDSMEEFEAGNESRGREIAMEGFESADEKLSRCS